MFFLVNLSPSGRAARAQSKSKSSSCSNRSVLAHHAYPCNTHLVVVRQDGSLEFGGVYPGHKVFHVSCQKNISANPKDAPHSSALTSSPNKQDL